MPDFTSNGNSLAIILGITGCLSLAAISLICWSVYKWNSARLPTYHDVLVCSAERGQSVSDTVGGQLPPYVKENETTPDGSTVTIVTVAVEDVDSSQPSSQDPSQPTPSHNNSYPSPPPFEPPAVAPPVNENHPPGFDVYPPEMYRPAWMSMGGSPVSVEAPITSTKLDPS
ncbi:hypothetical protein DFS34DRAFT_127147 [Phlyctochytrium arcticum]|nr:hypothetical protein DFS34DRAFT_127147 [Phlyctochytrium arcticum]